MDGNTKEQEDFINMVDPFSFSIFIPTITRPTLGRTLWSIRLQESIPDDEVIVIGDGPQPIARELFEQFRFRGRYVERPKAIPSDWGHGHRNAMMRTANAAWILAMDDDDEYKPGALKTIREALKNGPKVPHIFRMDNDPVVGHVWKIPQMTCGNVSTICFACPNDPEKLGIYTNRYGGDFDFIEKTCSFYPTGPVWREEFIATVRPLGRRYHLSGNAV